jgi:hypothetical protein
VQKRIPEPSRGMRRGIGGLLTDNHAEYYPSSTVLVKEYVEMIGSKGDRATGNGNAKLEISVEPLGIVNMTLYSTMILAAGISVFLNVSSRFAD